MAAGQNDSSVGYLATAADGEDRLELYSIVLSATMLFLAILFGGGGCVTVLIAMCIHKLLRKLRYILIAILLSVCCVLDFVWCPIEISRLVIHHQNMNGNIISDDVILNLKHAGSSLYIMLISALAAIIILICVQNALKLVRKYDSIPKVQLGVTIILTWVLVSISLTVAYVLVSLNEDDERVYHSINRTSFHFKIGLQIIWVILLLTPIAIMVALHLHARFTKTGLVTELSDLHSNENFTVPSLIIKSVEDMEEDDDDENSVALPSPDILKDSCSGSPVSKSSKSALKKRSGSPSSQKVLFADLPSPEREARSNFGEKMKSQNHLGVNMAAILGRRRHTIAQITEPHLDLIQKAKSYNYVRKFSVDISALQAQLENPKIHGTFPFHSQQDIKHNERDHSDSAIDVLANRTMSSRRSRDEMIQSQNIAEEPELENDHAHGADANDNDEKEPYMPDSTSVQSVHSQCPSVHSQCPSIHSQCPSVRSIRTARDSICPTPPLISLTQSDGEEKQIELNNTDNNTDDTYHSVVVNKKVHKPCKLSCLLVATFIGSILPMFLTELLRDSCLNANAYTNIVTCTTAISIVQSMIYPQLIFCVDSRINKAVHYMFVRTRRWIMHFFHQQQEVPTNDDISDTEV